MSYQEHCKTAFTPHCTQRTLSIKNLVMLSQLTISRFELFTIDYPTLHRNAQRIHIPKQAGAGQVEGEADAGLSATRVGAMQQKIVDCNVVFSLAEKMRLRLSVSLVTVWCQQLAEHLLAIPCSKWSSCGQWIVARSWKDMILHGTNLTMSGHCHIFVQKVWQAHALPSVLSNA